MDQVRTYRLFFVRSHSYFEEGTILELEDTVLSAASLDATFGQKFNTIPDEDHEMFGYRLPDRGDGIPGFISKDDVIPCPDFAENVPPGKCPVKITYQRVMSDADTAYDANLNDIGIFSIHVDQNLHWQRVVIPFPDKLPRISSVSLTNTLKNFEVDSYETPSLGETENGPAFFLQIGHVGPGFYEVDMRLERGRFVRIRFIKFFPPEFSARYESLKQNPGAEPVVERRAGSLSAILSRIFPRDADFDYPVEMMNHALALSTEWGENFREPIDERMLAKYPDLSAADIARLKKLADEAEWFILDLAERELASEIEESDIVPLARAKFPWVNDDQLHRIKNIGMYWARK